MPTYDYKCPQCNSVWEIHRSMEKRDDDTLKCPDCGVTLVRKITLPKSDPVWTGKFHDRWAQKTNYDGLGPTW